jgi:hypothetical protein
MSTEESVPDLNLDLNTLIKADSYRTIPKKKSKRLSPDRNFTKVNQTEMLEKLAHGYGSHQTFSYSGI